METSEDHKDGNKEGKNIDIAKVDINVLHEFLNHAGEIQIRTTAKEWGLNLTGQFNTCTGCARGKARQANTNKVSDTQAEHHGERLFVDLTGPFQESLTKRDIWQWLWIRRHRESSTIFRK